MAIKDIAETVDRPLKHNSITLMGLLSHPMAVSISLIMGTTGSAELGRMGSLQPWPGMAIKDIAETMDRPLKHNSGPLMGLLSHPMAVSISLIMGTIGSAELGR